MLCIYKYDFTKKKKSNANADDDCKVVLFVYFVYIAKLPKKNQKRGSSNYPSVCLFFFLFRKLVFTHVILGNNPEVACGVRLNEHIREPY